VTVQCAAAEIGQGSQTALSQIAAETLGISLDDVRFVSDNTVAPEAGKTSASRQTFVSGNAVQRAVTDALETVLSHTAELFEQRFDVQATLAELSAGDGHIHHAEIDETIPFKEAVRHCSSNGMLLTGTAAYTPLFDFDLETFEGSPYPTFSFATHGVVVEVDLETGATEVEQIIASHDVGQAVNPALVEGQIEGGAVMGLGHTLMEEVQMDGQGQIINGSLMGYHIPSMSATPDIDVHLVESNADEDGPYGAKGVGESALIPVGPAIANAVADATGERITELPLKSERIVRALPKDLIYQ
jgi:CO/xanthine dehydrogenase Mo-binding subunit